MELTFADTDACVAQTRLSNRLDSGARCMLLTSSSASTYCVRMHEILDTRATHGRAGWWTGPPDFKTVSKTCILEGSLTYTNNSIFRSPASRNTPSSVKSYDYRHYKLSTFGDLGRRAPLLEAERRSLWLEVVSANITRQLYVINCSYNALISHIKRLRGHLSRHGTESSDRPACSC